MTLSRLALAWAPVALLFLGVAWLTERWRVGPALRGRVVRVAGEALGTTLLASLWFDSLGHGGWWLLFLLMGVLVALRREGERALLFGLVDAARYVAAGALLVWRLG